MRELSLGAIAMGFKGKSDHELLIDSLYDTANNICCEAELIKDILNANHPDLRIPEDFKAKLESLESELEDLRMEID